MVSFRDTRHYPVISDYKNQFERFSILLMKTLIPMQVQTLRGEVLILPCLMMVAQFLCYLECGEFKGFGESCMRPCSYCIVGNGGSGVSIFIG